MYAYESERSPKMILRLYNNAWLHHELCYTCSLFQTPHSRCKLFGLYLHSITRHAAEQYELVCLKSVNAESQERMFGQCRGIAESCTNRQPANVIANVLFRMQTKKINSTDKTIVRNAAAHLPVFQGTYIPSDFVIAHKESWQAHLEKISPFLVYGEGTWWTKTENGFMFMDGVGSCIHN